ncbi:hypothetical protein G8770_14490 [Aestuariicella hydrocarbonica]|uniref:Uncharacterized protein n=1 Tax=Pseudomaricurvus hydrocarbonicus TaxID=1470433 RepID=A0A9E5MMI2_9GAMM|nr:hypothetical protein [Aestuariicella hydrocarbonica]NHO66755.1 hypothetical protein [Aestuariicella hydrocarbonica]
METRWVKGDLFGLDIPADAEALLSGGANFLTKIFHASGALSPDNRVTKILHKEEFFGGGTGSKLVLNVAFASPEPNFPGELFIKFSRNFEDELRDSARFMMVSEAKFAAFTRNIDFPVTVPACLFADVEAETGTGLLISERILFGCKGLEPLYPKCMDYSVPQPLEHYKTIIRAQAKLAATHRLGGLPAVFDEHFRYNPKQSSAMLSIRQPEEKLIQRAVRMFEFINRHPQLFPDNIRARDFHQQFLSDIPFVIAAEKHIKEILHSNPDFIALCHWNANIDNCWFWRDAEGILQCGLMDWAMVGQISIAQAIQGVISGAEPPIWDHHLDEILQVFVDEYSACGGPLLNVNEIRRHILLSLAVTGVSYFMSAPVAITREISDLEPVQSYQDESFQQHENARIQLHMMTRMLNVWQTRKLGELVRQLMD